MLRLKQPREAIVKLLEKRPALSDSEAVVSSTLPVNYVGMVPMLYGKFSAARATPQSPAFLPYNSSAPLNKGLAIFQSL